MSVFHTIGHSTRTLSEFTALLREAGLDLIVDVRTVPRSRKNPQFNRETLPDELASAGIGYVHIPELGGLRGRRKHDVPSPNTFWENDNFRNYADYALTLPFREGLDRLRQLGRERAPAVMCAEAVWWRCHRRIITDYLVAADETVFHIIGPGAIEPAKINPAAVRRANGGLIYP
ncbi:MAG: DUF488 domain-containing protein [Acetobacteraceae bacterium]|nr:DUF488 domain-containing protein [Acetobacteraceae bacterium]